PVSVYSRLIATAEHSGFASPLGLHANLIALNELGVPNVELIAAATLRPATLLGMSHHGLVENGFVADLILIDGNPFEDIRTLLQPIAIVDQGVLRSVEGLLNP
ncbi:MAG: amidohydrolase family protein, partial [Pseudomonadota bacterium]